MTLVQLRSRALVAFLLLIQAWMGMPCYAAFTNVLFSTGFEAEQGYDGRYTLAGQDKWVGEGTGGNGLVTNFFLEMKQQAFIGYFAPKFGELSSSVWRPIDYVPPVGSAGNVRFAVVMSVVDSTSQFRDEFRWSVYSTGGADPRRLFSLNFDNATLEISYSLDDKRGFINTGYQFSNAVLYDLIIDMNFSSNRWSAFLDRDQIVCDQPLSTTSAPLGLGDIDAVWVIGKTNQPGDNYLLFDNYQVLADSQNQLEPDAAIEYMAPLPGGNFLIRMSGLPGKSYALEYSNNLIYWMTLKTNTIGSDGWMDFLDVYAHLDNQRFYRARRVNP
jgi:hypothetical protein